MSGFGMALHLERSCGRVGGEARDTQPTWPPHAPAKQARSTRRPQRRQAGVMAAAASLRGQASSGSSSRWPRRTVVAAVAQKQRSLSARADQPLPDLAIEVLLGRGRQAAQPCRRAAGIGNLALQRAPAEIRRQRHDAVELAAVPRRVGQRDEAAERDADQPDAAHAALPRRQHDVLAQPLQHRALDEVAHVGVGDPMSAQAAPSHLGDEGFGDELAAGGRRRAASQKVARRRREGRVRRPARRTSARRRGVIERQRPSDTTRVTKPQRSDSIGRAQRRRPQLARHESLVVCTPYAGAVDEI